MSYDVDIELPECPTCGQERGDHWHGLTFNVRPLLVLALGPENGLRSLDGKRCGDVVECVSGGVAAISDPARFAEFEALNPPNGWGDRAGTEKFLRWLLAACERMPDATVRVW